MESLFAPNKLDRDQVWSALRSLCESESFRASPRVKNILKFVVEETLSGRGDALKEYVIATMVLGRDASFDPRLDTIVRTEARKLRSRLAEYYDAAGRNDRIRIEFVKGSYAPRFHAVPLAHEEETTPPETVASGERRPEPSDRPLTQSGHPMALGKGIRSSWALASAAVLVFAALGASVLTHSSVPQVPRPMDENRAGYKDYLRGQHFLAMQTPEGIRTAIDYFRQSIGKDQDFAPAYAGLSQAYGLLPRYSTASGSEVIPLMRDTALRAIKLDPSLSEAHLTLAQSYEHDFDWPNAGREFRQALRLAPKSASAYVAYGAFLSQSGDMSQALIQMTRAFELDPVSLTSAKSLANCLYWMREYEQAGIQYRVAIRLDPHNGLPHQGLGMALVQLGRFGEAIAELRLAKELLQDAPFPTAVLGYAYAKSGQRKAAMALQTELMERSKREPIPAVALAPVEIGLGNVDVAFSALEKAVRQHDFNLMLLKDPICDPLRKDPRFSDLFRRMNLNQDSLSEDGGAKGPRADTHQNGTQRSS